MRTTWRSFSSSLFASSLFSSLQAGGGEHTRPPVHPLQLKEQRVPGSLSLPILQLSLTATGFSLLRALQWSLTFVIAASATVALWFWWDSHVIAQLAAQREHATERAQETNRQFVRAGQ
ncbi:MAG: hypothetical protein AUI96_00210 [Nitrospirae bacterium 13_1_40CM_3_62_11]|nr:MAG: hypothetical protein AUI96_00210 [Nitrospirae bacterium 13_1_40CM_3_62_11]